MQPPLIPLSDKLRTSHLDTIRQIPPGDANLDPAPTCPCPHLNHNATSATFLPQPHVQSSRLVPGAWWHWRTFVEFLALRFCLFFVLSPSGKMGIERTS